VNAFVLIDRTYGRTCDRIISGENLADPVAGSVQSQVGKSESTRWNLDLASGPVPWTAEAVTTNSLPRLCEMRPMGLDVIKHDMEETI
jgi:hypothetical protein